MFLLVTKEVLTESPGYPGMQEVCLREGSICFLNFPIPFFNYLWAESMTTDLSGT